MFLTALAVLDAQSPPAPAAQAQAPGARASKGIPPRANPGEYLARAQAGAITIAAEFDRHAVPTPEADLTTEDYVCVEVGLFGPAGAHATVSSADFSLRINGKKAGLPAEQFAAVFRNLRDPSYNPPEVSGCEGAKIQRPQCRRRWPE